MCFYFVSWNASSHLCFRFLFQTSLKKRNANRYQINWTFVLQQISSCKLRYKFLHTLGSKSDNSDLSCCGKERVWEHSQIRFMCQNRVLSKIMLCFVFICITIMYILCKALWAWSIDQNAQEIKIWTILMFCFLER